MPVFDLVTNVPGDRVKSSEIISALSKAVAKAVGKPESYVLISLTTDRPMSFGGTEEPCAFAELSSIGGFGGKNAAISQALMAVVEEHLGVSSSRFYIKFNGPPGNEFGWRGATF